MDGASRERFRHVDAIFDAALDLEPNERAVYVAEACGGDDELRDRVRTLLEAHERSGGFLRVPAAQLAPVLLDDPPPGAAPAPERLARRRPR